MTIIFFEDPFYRNFEPLSLSHPVYMLLCGTSKIYKKWFKAIKCDDHGFLARPYLAPILGIETGKKVNTLPESDFILINGRVLPSPQLISNIDKLKPNESLISDDLLVAYRGNNDTSVRIREAIENLYAADGLESLKTASGAKESKVDRLDYIWNLVELNGRLITEEFTWYQKISGRRDSEIPGSSIINRQQVYMSDSAAMAPSVVIDASDGPVIIEANSKIEPFSFIQGPCYIGRDCRIVGGRIRSGTSLGPVCRVGGEVEESQMLGYCNKYHEGFLGHAYLGEWVNLGALTTNSDLKNNYKEISVEIGGETVNSGSIKAGCFIGDHTKTGIGTMLNTGINIGFSCNIYGAALFADKIIPSFSWGVPGDLIKYRIDKAVETAAVSVGRRGVEFTEAHKRLFEDINRFS